MIFTSVNFLVFLCVVLAVYWRLPRRGQNVFLLAASYFFYGFVHPWFCLLLAASTLVDYLCGLGFARWPQRRRLLLMASLVSNLTMLGVFKYFNFFVGNVQLALQKLGFNASLPVLNVLLPVGISFYTFQTLSYTIDVYRGLLTPRRNFIDFALFVALFPQLVAGPIERARNLLPQIERERTLDLRRIESAACLIIWGFFKKLVIADNLALYVDRLYLLPSLPGLLLVTAGVGFFIQLFADFSAYTDIARGTARLLGLELMQNFRAPFGASNPAEFWRRWHISLSSWIRDYVFAALPGSHRSGWRLAQNQMFTFLLFGLWHGAGWNYAIWGLYNGLLLVIYSLWVRPWTRRVRSPSLERLLRLGGVVVWFTLTSIGGIIFRQAHLATLLGYFMRNPLTHTPGELVVGLGMLSLTVAFAAPMLIQAAAARYLRANIVLRVALAWVCLAAVIFVAQEGTQEFVYFAF